MKNLFLGLLLALSFHANSQSNDENQIRSLLSRQSGDWNKGDIDGFMRGYWNHDSLMFIGKSGVTYGYNNTLKNYKKNYPDAASMGKLTFDLITIKKLSPNYFQVVGKWSLERTIGNVDGHFTLLLRKIKGEWVIISDHSS